MIELHDISKIYETKGSQVSALNQINLKIENHEILGIVGLSGSGKSTLLRLINRLIKPTHGTCEIDGVNIYSLKQKDINRMRHQIGMVFQHFNLLRSLTVYENVKLNYMIAHPHEKVNEAHLLSSLKRVGLIDKKDSYPASLSGEQLQRVAIARAIINKPKILLCDEITSALDATTASEIVDLIKVIAKEERMTIIFISHQLEIVKTICKRLIVMDKGDIIEDQNTKDLFINPKNELTKSLIKSVINHKFYALDDVYNIIYTNDLDEKTLLSHVIKTHQVDTNILFAQTTDILDEIIGYMTLVISGKHKLSALSDLKVYGLLIRDHKSGVFL